MTGVLILLGVWLGASTAIVAALLWVAGQDTQAAPPEPHDPECEACKAADDLVMQRFDLDLWGIELQERA